MRLLEQAPFEGMAYRGHAVVYGSSRLASTHMAYTKHIWLIDSPRGVVVSAAGRDLTFFTVCLYLYSAYR